jgi:hypothetical protein
MLSRALGETVVYRPLTVDQARTSGWPAAEEAANQFRFFIEASDAFLTHRDLDLVRTINPRLQSLEEWALEHRDELMSAAS